MAVNSVSPCDMGPTHLTARTSGHAQCQLGPIMVRSGGGGGGLLVARNRKEAN